MSSEPAGVPAPPTPEEPLGERVLRQARTGQLDEDRLLPGQDKRERDLTKKLDKLATQSGWYTFVSAQAHAIAEGKAPARRNAEIMVVQEVTRWRSSRRASSTRWNIPRPCSSVRRASSPGVRSQRRRPEEDDRRRTGDRHRGHARGLVRHSFSSLERTVLRVRQTGRERKRHEALAI